MSPTHWPASSTLASAVAWLLLSAVFAAAYVQGTEFAATKDSASVWGGVIGLSAFFAWLAVDYDEEEVAEGSSGSDEGSASIRFATHPLEAPRSVAVKYGLKIDTKNDQKNVPRWVQNRVKK